MKYFLFCIGLFTIAAAFIPRIKKDVWWIRGFEFPHAQLTFLNIIITTSFLFVIDYAFIDIIFIVGLFITIIYQLAILIPYTFFAKKQVKDCVKNIPESTISILSANVFMYNKNRTKLNELIKKYDPDMISLLEPNEKWRKDMEYLKKAYPYNIEIPQEETYGMLFYSKLPFVNSKIHYLIENDVPSIHAVVKMRNNEKINIHCLHPKPPSPTENEKSTERDAELLLVAKEIEKNTTPTIVIGDLNDVAWSKTTRNFQKISSLLDPRIGRGFFNTFHAKYPFLRWPLDHFFNSYHFTLVDIERLSNIGSDHFPIFIKLQMENKKPDADIDIPSANKENYEAAEEKINKVTDEYRPNIELG